MKEYKNGDYVGERALFNTHNAKILECHFHDGESPLKESSDLDISGSRFSWKYPLWYCNNVVIKNSNFEQTARSGIWYTNNIEIVDSIIDAPKLFRRCYRVKLNNVKLNNALETLWKCDNVEISNAYIKGDYFGFNSSNVVLDNVTVDGNYILDGAKNVLVTNSVLNSKDAFWNCENVVVKNTKIIGEYLCWNTKNITFINCNIESDQGMCYVDKLVLENCTTKNTDLAFEYSSNIDATINSNIDSIKNPNSGIIRVLGANEIIFDENMKTKKEDTQIFVNGIKHIN